MGSDVELEAETGGSTSASIFTVRPIQGAGRIARAQSAKLLWLPPLVQ